MKIIEEEIRYPEKGDKFFIEEGNKDDIAWLHTAFHEFGGYADSYQTGAINLIDTALENKSLRDYHVYPVIFLVRHFLELRLKELIQGINYYQKQKKEFPETHDLQHLWSKFKKGYSDLGENTSDKCFKNVEILIKEMVHIDPKSMSFRYPVANGKSTKRLDYVNLQNLRETFIKVCFLFDGIAMQIAHYVEITEDMVQEVYRNYWR